MLTRKLLYLASHAGKPNKVSKYSFHGSKALHKTFSSIQTFCQSDIYCLTFLDLDEVKNHFY